MATYTSNYGWVKPSGSDNVDISVLNDNLDDQDITIHDAFLNMAPPFSESSTYAVDDIVLYGTGLYKCHTAVVTPGSWTGSTNWQVYKLSEGGSGGGGTSNYNQLTNKPQINSVELSGNKTSAQLGLMASDGVVANPTGQTSGTLTALEVGGTKYAVPSGGTSDYTDLTNKPSINGVKLSGNKTTSDLGIDKTAVGLGNVPNVSTNDQTPTFTEASTRNNIASGEKLSVILGKIAKFFNDLKTVAFSGSFSDLSNKPSINSVELSGNKTTGDLGINADNVMMSDGVTSVEDAITEYGISTYDSNLHYKIFDPLMILSGYFTGNGNSTIDLGIGMYMGIVNVRSTGDGTMGIYLINNGVLNGWDGSTSRVFTNNVSYMISGVLHKVVS